MSRIFMCVSSNHSFSMPCVLPSVIKSRTPLSTACSACCAIARFGTLPRHAGASYAFLLAITVSTGYRGER